MSKLGEYLRALLSLSLSLALAAYLVPLRLKWATNYMKSHNCHSIMRLNVFMRVHIARLRLLAESAPDTGTRTHIWCGSHAHTQSAHSDTWPGVAWGPLVKVNCSNQQGTSQPVMHRITNSYSNNSQTEPTTATYNILLARSCVTCGLPSTSCTPLATRIEHLCPCWPQTELALKLLSHRI